MRRGVVEERLLWIRLGPMRPFQTIAVLLSIAAAFAYVNHRWIRRPAAIALMAMSLGLSLLLVALDRIGLLHVSDFATSFLDRINLDETLLHGMLGVLLFAGALHVKVDDLRKQWRAISVLAIAATLLSTFLIGGFVWSLLWLVGIPLSFGYCLLFGALISPTDPIAVLGILEQAKVPKSMETQIVGESLFNDGVGVVLFSTILGVVASGHADDTTVASVFFTFVREALGGVLFGLVTGYVTYRLLRSIDHYKTELLLTVALVIGGYALAEQLHVSAPITVVTAGLLIGNIGRALGMSDTTRDHIDKFWALVDEILNAVLFVIVGFEVIRLRITSNAALVCTLIVPIVLVARWVSIAVPFAFLARGDRFARETIWILTWGGLRGGISVALALSIASGPEQEIIVAMTYCVVAFSILVQGLTLGRWARRSASTETPEPPSGWSLGLARSAEPVTRAPGPRTLREFGRS